MRTAEGGERGVGNGIGKGEGMVIRSADWGFILWEIGMDNDDMTKAFLLSASFSGAINYATQTPPSLPPHPPSLPHIHPNTTPFPTPSKTRPQSPILPPRNSPCHSPLPSAPPSQCPNPLSNPPTSALIILPPTMPYCSSVMSRFVRRISKPPGHPKKIFTKNFHLAIIAEGSHPMLSTTFHLDTQDTATIRDIRRAIGSQLQALHNGSAPPCCLFGDLVRGDVRMAGASGG